MSTEIASLLVVNIITFLSTIVTMIATSKKASAERRDAQAALDRQFEQAREDIKLKAKLDAERERLIDERAERDRKWAVQDREAAEANARQMSVRIDGASRLARAAIAATNIGSNLDADPEPPPPPSRRQRVGTVADRRPEPEAEHIDFSATERQRPERQR